MAKSRRSMKRRSSRKAHRKGSRKAHRKGSRKTSHRMRGGNAPVNYANPGPMDLNLAQGKQFAEFHKEQHGGAAYGPYPGAVDQASVLPSDLIASAKLLPLNASFDYIRQFGPSSDNPNLAGGKRRRGSRKASRKARKASRKASRKARKASRKVHRKTSRKTYRKQRGGLYRWGGGGRRRGMKGGAYSEMRFPMPVADESKMLIPSALQQQAGLNPEWRLAENPMAFAPKM
jgi:hypothetical protein